MARTCVFCGGTPLTKEHVLPKWLKDAFEPSMLPRVQYVRATNATSRVYVAPLLNEQVKVVCASCNNGWMNDLEEGVRPFLPALIRGGLAVLDPDEQHALTAWSLKTMLMYQHTHRREDQVAIPPEDFKTFYAERTANRLMTARVAFMLYPPDDSIPLVDTQYQGYGQAENSARAWIGTLKIGCLVIQILRLGPLDDDRRVLPFSNTASTRTIWPSTRRIGWPLRQPTPYEHMRGLAHPETLNWQSTAL
ncbi:hypothetical protein ACU639_27055 [Streptomyces cynarae]|uniref:hypothetical protein n=1 Tax=Streptomyces cynarae TaxID=2981134 RepID=UPI00406D4B86